MIGIDPHKRSNTALVLDAHENVLAKQRFPNDRDGYHELKQFARPGGSGQGPSRAPGVWVSAWRSGSPAMASGC